jgi:hypothetical protein
VQRKDARPKKVESSSEFDKFDRQWQDTVRLPRGVEETPSSGQESKEGRAADEDAYCGTSWRISPTRIVALGENQIGLPEHQTEHPP